MPAIVSYVAQDLEDTEMQARENTQKQELTEKEMQEIPGPTEEEIRKEMTRHNGKATGADGIGAKADRNNTGSKQNSR